MLSRLWSDERGGVNTAEMLLLMTIMTIGTVVGSKSLRDSAVTEFADLAQALANLDQTYSFSGLSITWGSTTLTTVGSQFTDVADFCDSTDINGPHGPGSKCVDVAMPTAGEAAS